MKSNSEKARKASAGRRGRIAAATGVLMAFLCGCKTVDPDAATKFAASVTAVKIQTDDALNAVAALTRDSSINYAAAQPTLAEANFVVTPAGDTISEWDNAFATLEIYAQNLSALVSPNAARNFEVAATNLYCLFNETAGRLKANSIHSQAGVNGLLATAFTETGELIIRARQEAAAVKLAGATDTNIAAICQLFAGEIGADRVTAPGLRKTVYETVWKPRMAALTAPFLSASAADKLAICQKYADLLALRDAEDQILAGLRRSLLALKDAHHALAHGEPASIQADLAVVTSEIQHTRDLFNQFSKVPSK